MVRGCQKRIYHIKNPDSALFEEVYFILKQPSVRNRAAFENDLTKEANRIVQEATTDTPWHKSPSIKGACSAGQKVCAFVIGAASSSAIIGGIALLLAFA